MVKGEIYKDIRGVVNPEHSALIIWDVQNMLVGRIFNKEEFIKNNTELIKGAHELEIPVIFTKITPLPEKFESAPRLARGGLPKDMDKNMFELTIKPEDSDIVWLLCGWSIRSISRSKIQQEQTAYRSMIICKT